MSLQISDPTYRPETSPSRFKRGVFRLITDPRDFPFVALILQVALTVIPFAVYLFCTPRFAWGWGVAYNALVMGYFFGPVILMLHNTSHRPLFRGRAAGLNHLLPWAVTPFFGQSPGTYFSHHIGMHHVEGNLPDDLSSTMRYQRDSVRAFGHYLGDFYLVGLPRLLRYFRAKRRMKLFRKALLGELSFYVVVGLLLAFNWRAALVVFVIPFVVARFGMMAGNWAQHAFIDAADPSNPYRNSITCINTTYNRRCFNDGYHIGHHVKSARHWTEMPSDFMENRARYLQEGAIVFEGIDYFGIWFCLMFKRYDWLAARSVSLSDAPVDQSRQMALLRERTRQIHGTAA